MKEEHNSIKFDAKVITDHFYGSVEIHNGRRYDDNLTFVKNKLDSQYRRGIQDAIDEIETAIRQYEDRLNGTNELFREEAHDEFIIRRNALNMVKSELQSKLKDYEETNNAEK